MAIYKALVQCESIEFRARDIDDAQAKYEAFYDDRICPEHLIDMGKCGCLIEYNEGDCDHSWEITE